MMFFSKNLHMLGNSARKIFNFWIKVIKILLSTVLSSLLWMKCFKILLWDLKVLLNNIFIWIRKIFWPMFRNGLILKNNKLKKILIYTLKCILDWFIAIMSNILMSSRPLKMLFMINSKLNFKYLNKISII
jgi:hypothetical protein